MTRSVILLLLIACWCRNAAAQLPFTRDIWLNESGTPVRTNGLAFDADGRMWLATENGLYTYNGRTVAPVGDSVGAVTAVTTYGADVFYGCRDGNVYRRRDGERSLLLHAGASITCISVTAYLPYGLFIGTEGDGMYFLGLRRTLHFSTRNGLPDDYVYSVSAAGGGIYIGTDKGVFTNNGNASFPRKFYEIQRVKDIARVVKWTLSDIWMGMQERGVDRKNLDMGDSRLGEREYGKDQWAWGQVNDILPAGDAKAWIATEDGWLIYADHPMGGRPDDLRFLPVLHLGSKISAINTDRSGNLWLATANGLTMVTGNYLRKIGPGNHFSIQQLSALACDDNNGIWYTQNNALWYYDRDEGRAKKIWHSPVPINCLYSDRKNRLWIGTSGKGVIYRAPDGSMTTITHVPELADAHILSIAGSGERLWVSSLNGVEELQIGPDGRHVAAKHHGKRTGIGSDYIYRIFIDGKGRTWFATDGAGITMLDSLGVYHHWNSKTGMPSDVIYAIAEDAAGAIWATTLNDGVFRYYDTTWKAYQKSDGIQEATAYAVAANKTGQVLIVNAKGIDEWYPADQEFRHINRRSGLGIDSTSTAINAAASDAEGNVYIPYQDGFLVFGNQPDTIQIGPSVHLTNVSLFFKNIPRTTRDFAYDQNHLTFRFEGISYAHNEPLIYRYRLEGYNNDWIQTTDEAVTYPRLPPGTYRFCIQVATHEAFEHAAADVYTFTIATPFWRRRWFWIALTLLTGTAILAGLRWRVRSLQKVAQLKQERMIFEYEHLKSQVNPHFLFNSLNTLANLIEEDREAAVNYTVQLSDLYRDTLSFHEQEQIPLSEEWKVLERYFYIQHSRFGPALVLSASVPEHIRQRKKIVPLALQLLVENAIKHNVVSRSAPLIIFIEADEETLTVRNAIRPKATREKSTGLGLRNIRQRYAPLTKREVSWTIRNNEFIVTLPLL